MRKRALGAVVVVAAVAGMIVLYATRGPTPSFEWQADRFPQLPPAADFPFDLVVTDMDLDGDPDLLVNWHHLGRPELFDNRRGRFALLNPSGADASGLFDNRGIPDLFAKATEMIAEIDAEGKPGVYLWHDLNRHGAWNFYVLPQAPVQLSIRTNTPIESINLESSSYTKSGKFDVRAEISTKVHFRVKAHLVATRMEVRTTAPVYVGKQRRRLDGERVVLWKGDPHGIAWVDAVGSPHPDLYISRGGLKGTLKPPQPPKNDQFFEHAAGELLYEWASDAIPADYGRGRKVAWVDVDGDGRNELYVGNTETRNVLLQRNQDGRYRNVAGAKGLDFMLGDTFAWLDLNADGFDELVIVDARGFHVAWNRSGDFTVSPGEEIGLVFRDAPIPDRRLFNGLSLHVVDFDNDGHLDLWLSGHGSELRHALYRFDGARFVDVTTELGLSGESQVRSLVLLDVDNDGFVDAVTLGARPQLLHNRQGQRFDALPLAPDEPIAPRARAVAADVDGDGRTDLIVVGHVRRVARNTSDAKNTRLEVRFSTPRRSIGAVVRARYENGMVRAQRYGSADSTQYSQGLQPLVFGVPPETRIESLEIRWPGGAVREATIASGANSIELSPPQASP